MIFVGETESQKALRETALLDMLIESRRGIWDEKYSHVEINESEHGITSFWRHDSPSFVPQIFSREMFFDRVKQINAKVSDGMNDKQQLAAMGEHMAEQAAQSQPLCMAKRIEELEAQLLVTAEALKNLRDFAESNIWDEDVRCVVVGSINDALSGKLPEPAAPEGLLLIGYRNHSSPNGLRRFMTPKQYRNQTDGIKKWYEPVYAAPVPEGWQLVPVLTTKGMRAAFDRGTEEWDAGDCRLDYPDHQWAAMLSAAPKPESK